jgi:hypothetical protein
MQEHNGVLHDERFPSANALSPSLYEEDYQEQFPLGGGLPVGPALRTSEGLCVPSTEISDNFLSQPHAVMQGSYAFGALKSIGASLGVAGPVSEDISEVQM